MNIKTKDLISEKEAMELLGFTNARSLRNAIDNGRLPVSKTKPHYRCFLYSKKDIEWHLNNQMITP